MKSPRLTDNGLSDDERRRPRDLREIVDEGLLGGDKDGELTLVDFRRLEFWAWLRWRDGTDVAAELDPIRARALRIGVMRRIRRTHDA